MGLSILSLDDDSDPVIDVVTLNEEPLDEAHIETVSDFTQTDDIETLVAGAAALEGILIDIRANGINQSIAKEISVHSQASKSSGVGLEGFTFYRRVGGNNAYTEDRSIEGLAVAIEEIGTTIKETFKKVLARLVEVYKRFIGWIKERFGKIAPEQLQPSPAAKAVASRGGLEKAVRFLIELPEDADAKAAAIARFATGAPDSFRASISSEVTHLGQRMASLFEKIEGNKTYSRIAAGDVSVKELVKQDADEMINKIIKNASDAAQNALKCRNAAQLTAALEKVDEAIAGFDDISSATFDTDGKYEGDSESGVNLLTIVRNLTNAVNDLESSNMSNSLRELTLRLDSIMRTAEQTTRAEVEEFIPEDADAQLRTTAITSIMKLYSKLAGVGKTVATLWETRIASLRGINTVLEDIGELIASFERGLSREAAKLEQEPKDAFVKSMTNFGFIIEV